MRVIARRYDQLRMNNPDPRTSGFRDGHSAELLAAVYEHLRAIARQRMSKENPGHTLQATALVHEAFLRIGQDRRLPFRDRAHFYATAAEAMRRILIDHARSKNTDKRQPRGGGVAPPELMSVVDLAENPDPDQILALDRAMERLEGAEPEVAAVVRLRFFAGLTVDDTAEALAISPRQVDRLWGYARAWLSREVGPIE
jgi:RNA polymerase sigma factor (TIGR02999 family)